MDSQYPPPFPPTYRPEKRGIPTWAWVLIGCGCGVPLLLVPILAAILFPVFSQARLAAREASCRSNLKQLGLAIMMYAQDYDQRLPLARSWMDTTGPYYKNETILHCPDVQGDQSAYGYAYNSRLNAFELMKLPSPATTPLMYDSTNLSRNASDPVSSLPNPPRHRNNNMGYADGHVQFLSQGPGSPTR